MPRYDLVIANAKIASNNRFVSDAVGCKGVCAKRPVYLINAFGTGARRGEHLYNYRSLACQAVVIREGSSLATLLQIDRDGVRFAIAGVLTRVCDGITPNGFSGRGRFLFRPAIRITELERASAQHIDDAGRMRVHRLFFARLESIFEDANLIIFEQNLVKLWRCCHRVLRRGRHAHGRQ